MSKSTRLLLSVVILLILSQACAAGIPAPDADVVNTAIVQTIIVALTQTATSFVPVSIQESPIATFTPDLPTLVSTESLTPTSLFTPTPVVPQITVSEPTNCRTGPGQIYDRVGALLPGEAAEVVGRTAGGDYWLIRIPNRSNELCWLWGRYATLAGNTGVLPVHTPPPTPTFIPTSTPSPNFAASYEGKDSCSGWWVDIKLNNTGGMTFRSIALLVTDTATNTFLPLHADTFTNRDGCNPSEVRENLPSGVTRIVSSPVFSYDPAGHKLSATITLCSELGLNGTCRTQVIQFTP